MSFGTTMANRHQPVYTADQIITAGTLDLRHGYEMLAFNRAYPTRRHHWHACHVMFGVPCNELCKPSRKSDSSVGLIERIKAAYRIEDIAERHTTLRGTHTLHGKCFLHGETKGEAFTIWVDDQKWKCFGRCGIGGDIVDLVRAMKERGIEWQK